MDNMKATPESCYQQYQHKTLALMSALKARDLTTQEHSERLVNLACQLGKNCGLSSRELTRLKLSARLHDIGKIGIPDKILLKPSRLTSEQSAVMQSHTEIGFEIVSNLEIDDRESIAIMVKHHHEHFDGSGYPEALKAEDIPIGSRIISVVDSFDAMIEPRPYHLSRSLEQVKEIILSERGSKHDPYVVGKFMTQLTAAC